MSMTAAALVSGSGETTSSWWWHPAWSWLTGMHAAFSVTLIVVLVTVVVIGLRLSRRRVLAPGGSAAQARGAAGSRSQLEGN